MEAFAEWAGHRYPAHERPDPSCFLCGQMAEPAAQRAFCWKAAVHTPHTLWKTIAAIWERPQRDPTSDQVPYKEIAFETHHVVCGRCAGALVRRARSASLLRHVASLTLALSLVVALPSLCWTVAMALTPGQMAWGFAWAAGGGCTGAMLSAFALRQVRRITLPPALRRIGLRPFSLVRACAARGDEPAGNGA